MVGNPPIAAHWSDAPKIFTMKTHPISEEFTKKVPLRTSPTGPDPQAENPNKSSNPLEKLPTTPESEAHYFYSPGIY